MADLYRAVLDGGFVRLVSYMQPAEGSSNWTGDLEVVRNARVSYDADWRTGENENNDAKLLGYLHKNRHTSPFEAMVFTFECQVPIFVLRQWHRHRTWSYNEVSARYTELPENYYVPSYEDLTTQATSNKQARTEVAIDTAYEAQQEIDNLCREAFALYRKLRDRGLARELSRIVLPLATYSRMFCTVDLHNLFHFLELRLHEHAQKEIRVYAQAMLDIIDEVVPHCVTAFMSDRATHKDKDDCIKEQEQEIQHLKSRMGWLEDVVAAREDHIRDLMQEASAQELMRGGK